MNSTVASQEGQETAKGAEEKESYGPVKKAIIQRLEERFPDRVIPWGAMVEASEGFEYGYFAQIAREWTRGLPERKAKYGTPRVVIAREIATKYPCMEVPSAVMKGWEYEFGISRQRVHQIVQREGAKLLRRQKPPRTCLDCDAPPEKYARRCAEHRYVRLVCDSCGNEFAVNRFDVLRRAEQASGRKHLSAFALCSKACRQGRGIKFMKENPDIPAYLVAKEFGVTTGAVYHWRDAMAMENP